LEALYISVLIQQSLEAYGLLADDYGSKVKDLTGFAATPILEFKAHKDNPTLIPIVADEFL
jgi:hypothetical protein